jgi:hypothetical protein
MRLALPEHALVPLLLAFAILIAPFLLLGELVGKTGVTKLTENELRNFKER